MCPAPRVWLRQCFLFRIPSHLPLEPVTQKHEGRKENEENQRFDVSRIVLDVLIAHRSGIASVVIGMLLHG